MNDVMEQMAEAVKAVIAATSDYLPPDGISKDELINRVLEATDNPKINAALAAYEAASEQTEAQPVGWRWRQPGDARWHVVGAKPDDIESSEAELEVHPLYLHPTQQTEAQASDAWVSVDDALPKCSKKPNSFGVQVLIWPHFSEDGHSDSPVAFYGRRISSAPCFYIYGRAISNVHFWRPLPQGPSNAAIAKQKGEE